MYFQFLRRLISFVVLLSHSRGAVLARVLLFDMMQGKTARTYLFLHMIKLGPGGRSGGAFCAPALFFAIPPSEGSKARRAR